MWIQIAIIILGFLASRYSNKFLDQLAKKSLSYNLFSKVKSWAKKLPSVACLNPGSIFINPFEPIQSCDGLSIITIKQQIYRAKLPSQMDWFNALIERYKYIIETNPDTQKFYKLDRPEAEQFLNSLATNLHETCLRDEKLLKTDLISRFYGCNFITHEALEKHLIEFNKRQIASHKKTAKYIPDIFVENHDAKEICRFFLYPRFFWGKFLWNIKKLNFSFLNHLLKLVGIDEFNINGRLGTNDEYSFSNSGETVDSINKTLTDKVECLEKLRNEKLDNLKTVVKPDRLELAREIWYHIRSAAYRNSCNLLEIQKQLDAITKRLVLITSRAGRGKTNFLCDLVDNVIAKRGIPAVFFNAKEMEHNSENLIAFLHKKILPITFETPQECFDVIRAFCQKENHYFTIIIDALNEVNNTALFSSKLEEFISDLLKHDYIKIILSCRTEYIEYRFNNLKSQFEGTLVSIENLELSDCDKDTMLEKYKIFFNISANFYGNAYYTLTGDPLMLRFYCETYGDPSCDTVKDLGAVGHVDKTDLFHNYLDSKIESIVLSDRQGSGVNVGFRKQFIDALMNVISSMIDNKCYGNVRIDNIDAAHLRSINRLLREGMLLRKDIIKGTNPLDDCLDVLNFTYDEFRDYLIANYLIHEIWKKDQKDKFAEFVDSLVETKELGTVSESRVVYYPSVIAEGVGRFIIQIAKQNKLDDLESEYKTAIWYEQVRLDAIFTLDENYISEEDIHYVKDSFMSGVDVSSIIIWELWHRKNSEQFTKLNMEILYSVLRDLTAKQYSTLVNPVFENYMSGRAYARRKNHFTWEIDKLSRMFSNFLSKKPKQQDIKIFEFLIFLFSIPSRNYHSPALDVYDEFIADYPEVAIEQLVANYKIKHLNILLHIVKKLMKLKTKYDIPDFKEIVQYVINKVIDVDENEYNKEHLIRVYYPVFVELNELDDSIFTKEQKTFIDNLKSKVVILDFKTLHSMDEA